MSARDETLSRFIGLADLDLTASIVIPDETYKCGGFSNVWMGSLRGNAVAVKELRYRTNAHEDVNVEVQANVRPSLFTTLHA